MIRGNIFPVFRKLSLYTSSKIDILVTEEPIPDVNVTVSLPNVGNPLLLIWLTDGEEFVGSYTVTSLKYLFDL